MDIFNNEKFKFVSGGVKRGIYRLIGQEECKGRILDSVVLCPWKLDGFETSLQILRDELIKEKKLQNLTSQALPSTLTGFINECVKKVEGPFPLLDSDDLTKARIRIRKTYGMFEDGISEYDLVPLKQSPKNNLLTTKYLEDDIVLTWENKEGQYCAYAVLRDDEMHCSQMRLPIGKHG